MEVIMNKRQFDIVTTWQKKTFGNATALSCLNHLEQEIEELHVDLIENAPEENIRMEFADCFILLYGAAARQGMSYEDISAAVWKKMGINFNRKWGKPDANGVVNHIK